MILEVDGKKNMATVFRASYEAFTVLRFPWRLMSECGGHANGAACTISGRPGITLLGEREVAASLWCDAPFVLRTHFPGISSCIFVYADDV